MKKTIVFLSFVLFLAIPAKAQDCSVASISSNLKQFHAQWQKEEMDAIKGGGDFSSIAPNYAAKMKSEMVRLDTCRLTLLGKRPLTKEDTFASEILIRGKQGKPIKRVELRVLAHYLERLAAGEVK